MGIGTTIGIMAKKGYPKLLVTAGIACAVTLVVVHNCTNALIAADPFREQPAAIKWVHNRRGPL